VIPPELKRRSSITLGVAARKNLLSSPEDSIYPDPKKAGGHHGGIQKIYMNDQDWEEYKKHHAEKNGYVTSSCNQRVGADRIGMIQLIWEIW